MFDEQISIHIYKADAPVLASHCVYQVFVLHVQSLIEYVREYSDKCVS